MLQNRLRTILFLGLLLLLASCSYRPVSRTQTPNTSTTSLNRTNLENSTPVLADMAQCNGLTSSSLTAQIRAYFDSSNRYSPNLLRMHISQIESNFENSNTQIVFRKWKANSTGETFQDATPLRVRIETRATHQVVSNYRNGLQWALIRSDLQNYFTEDQSMTEILDSVNFVIELNDPNGSFQILKMSLYRDNTWEEDHLILIPAFTANPTKYASDHPTILQQFHPLNDARSTGFATDYFNALCF